MGNVATTNRLTLAMKRSFDILLSILAIVLLSPFLCVLSIFLVIESGSPVLFAQQRVGLKGKPFRILKFRSMIPNAVNVGLGLRTSEDDPRVTRVGKFMREYHLDELPQLINVLKGDMSIVGPRPTILSQVETYTPFERRRLEVRPGITGLAQVSGNNELSWEERIKLDVYYVDNMSFLMDLKIILRTFSTVANREGLYGEDGMVHDKAKRA
jgi:lipopolysaccharide/colanic/teichoic acid biosynthesis glycosyltransferase